MSVLQDNHLKVTDKSTSNHNLCCSNPPSTVRKMKKERIFDTAQTKYQTPNWRLTLPEWDHKPTLSFISQGPIQLAEAASPICTTFSHFVFLPIALCEIKQQGYGQKLLWTTVSNTANQCVSWRICDIKHKETHGPSWSGIRSPSSTLPTSRSDSLLRSGHIPGMSHRATGPPAGPGRAPPLRNYAGWEPHREEREKSSVSRFYQNDPTTGIFELDQHHRIHNYFGHVTLKIIKHYTLTIREALGASTNQCPSVGTLVMHQL